MPDDHSLKLFAIYIGGDTEFSNIEVHDVRFCVAPQIEDCYEALLDQWFGTPESLHLDSWWELDVVDGYRIRVASQPQEWDQRLYFVNMGAYRPGDFSELHENVFVVSDSMASAKKRALQTCLQGSLQIHRDNLYDIDDCIQLEQVDRYHIHLTPTDQSSQTEPINAYHRIPKDRLQAYLAHSKDRK